MTYSNLLPRTINITGADLSGSDGTANRTYTLSDDGVLSSGIDIVINGTSLMEGSGKDFTLSSTVVTFLNIVDNSDIIRITYWITQTAISSQVTLETSTSLKYATPLMLAQMLGMAVAVPSRDVGGTLSYEEVGTGDESASVFYLDHQEIISDTYTIYYGASASSVSELTETTHYSLDTDTGKLTLTAAGLSLVGTDNIYAEYTYYKSRMLDSYVVAVLSRAEKEVDRLTNTTYTDGTVTNPNYPSTIEIQESEGYFDNRIITHLKPLIDIESTIDGDITSSQTTIDLATGDGSKYPSSGYIVIDSEVISYTGVSTDQLTGVTRGILGTTAAAHTDGATVHSTILFVSNTSEGTSASYTVQPWKTTMYATEYGLFYRYKDSDPDFLTALNVADRIKIIYLYGNKTISGDITRLTLLLAKRMLIQDNIGSSMISGRNEFRPEMMNVDNEEISSIVGSHIVLPMINT